MFCTADCSNWQEFLGNLNGTRVAFGEAHACEGHDWKVRLENPGKDLLVPAVVTCEEVSSFTFPRGSKFGFDTFQKHFEPTVFSKIWRIATFSIMPR